MCITCVCMHVHAHVHMYAVQGCVCTMFTKRGLSFQVNLSDYVMNTQVSVYNLWVYLTKWVV